MRINKKETSFYKKRLKIKIYYTVTFKHSKKFKLIAKVMHSSIYTKNKIISKLILFKS